MTMPINLGGDRDTHGNWIGAPRPEDTPVARRILADNASREQYPLYDGLFAYFPAALCEVARWSVVGNDKHNPGQPLHWARDKSTDHENKILRHLIDAEQVDKDGFIEAVALCWRSLALCQTILEKRGWPEGANARRKTSTAAQPSAAPPSPIAPLWQEPYPLTVGVPQHWAELAPPVAPLGYVDMTPSPLQLPIR
jgi:hypothetical protein